MSAVFKFGLCITVAWLALMPLAGVLFAWFENAGQGLLEIIASLWLNPKIQKLALETAYVSLAVSLSCLCVGLVAVQLINCLYARAKKWAIFLLAATFLISPYIYVQGFIGLLGSNGSLWQWLSLEPLWNIYSYSGLIVLMTLSTFPLAVLVIILGASVFPRKIAEELEMYNVSFFQKMKRYYAPKYLASMLFAFWFVFARSFWAYEIASMLRINTFSIELLAAFGSFYDYRLALGLMFLPVLGIILLSACMIPYFKSIQISGLGLSEEPKIASRSNDLLSHAALLLMLFVVFLPVIGLMAQIQNGKIFSENTARFSGEILNTLWSGGWAMCIALPLSFLWVAWIHIHEMRRMYWITCIWCLWSLAVPGVMMGMSAVYLSNELIYLEAVRMEMVQLWAAFPVTTLAFIIAWLYWPRQWIESLRIYSDGRALKYAKVILPNFSWIIFLVASITFIWAVKEVPASLLNVAPDGATLALTIETLLHFDQPEKVASLCVLQLLVCISLFAGLYCTRYLFCYACRQMFKSK